MFVELPPSVDQQGPTLRTLVEVGQILELAQDEPPLSLAEINRRMEASRTRHKTVRSCVDFLERLGFVTTGSQGAQWTYAGSSPAEVEYDTELLENNTREREAEEFPGPEGASEAWPRFKEFEAKRDPIRDFYRGVKAPIAAALTALVEDLDYETAQEHLQDWRLFVDENASLLNDIGVDGELRFPHSLIKEIDEAIQEAKDALEEEDYESGVESIRNANSLILERRKQEFEVLKEMRKSHHLDD